MFEAGHAKVDGPGKLQEYGALNVKKKFNPEGLKKERLKKKNNEKSIVCFWWTVINGFIILT